MEYEDGVHKTVQFAPLSRSVAEYEAIHITTKFVVLLPYIAPRALKESMVTRGMSLREIVITPKCERDDHRNVQRVVHLGLRKL
ncbi:uncharacterized protein BJ212DRAFT_1333605 [Suillus subaureus]|uniref:Uncharacterized protein n=1 Tax=Suillus subaureus TaxID=48587 RepID=A0A9P7EHV5_9AGAM|nr:uncharacterized protein BJ212DRAFT_1333605 [Suillus subaureus]KAG1821789.1 hypothetical protein BJ212DRAFT_1333605 [Suillus subaureus]